MKIKTPFSMKILELIASRKKHENLAYMFFSEEQQKTTKLLAYNKNFFYIQ